MEASYKKYVLGFNRPSGTSRGILTEKETWILQIERNGKIGIGECGMLRGLSCDDVPEFEHKLQWACDNVSRGREFLDMALIDFPSIRFGFEMAFMSLNSENPFILFNNCFSHGSTGIPINGLVWMGDRDYMLAQVEKMLGSGFNCIKLKVGAIDFDKELDILQTIRSRFSPGQIELRVDANGAFSSNDALYKISQLAGFQIHSIEQPIGVRQPDMMAELVKSARIPIALDEELIGVNLAEDKFNLLQKIRPQYIILKPSLVGGFKSCDEWIEIAESLDIGWWLTSALESNVGLNAIAQYAASKDTKMHQGLGTGSLYRNNFDSPLEVAGGKLWYRRDKKWDISASGF